MKNQEFIDLVKSEMTLSLGCTEPVAVGLAVSNTCIHLDKAPNKIKLKISSNIFKNAFNVKIPHTNEAGIPLAASLGYLLAKENNDMEIFSMVNAENLAKAHKLLDKDFIELEVIQDTRVIIEVIAQNEDESVKSLTLDRHDQLIYVEKDGKILYDARRESQVNEDLSILENTISELVQVACEIPIEEIYFLRQAIEVNSIASNEGLENDYGMKIGKTIKEMMDSDLLPRDLFYYVKMTVAGASDMRMGGGPYSAMTVLGSGNQGFQAILPVVATCKFLDLSEEKTLRALFMCILIAIRIKYAIGRLSPICGAMFSGASSAAAICWILGGNQTQIEGAMQNVFANLSGIMCDGAKDGCAIKISTCSGEAVLAAKLALNGCIATQTDGIVSKTVEQTIESVARLSKEGMKDVDMNLINIMIDKDKR